MSYSVRFKQDVSELHGKDVDFRVYAVSERPRRGVIVRGVGTLVIKDTKTEGVYEVEIHHSEVNPTPSSNPHSLWVEGGLYSQIPLTQEHVDTLLVLEDGSLRIWEVADSEDK